MNRYLEMFQEDIAATDVLVIGDTPRDIACAKPFGAAAMAVATGPYSVDQLRGYDPDFLFEDLSDVDLFFEKVKKIGE